MQKRKLLGASLGVLAAAAVMLAPTAEAASNYEVRDGAVDHGDGSYTIDTTGDVAPPYGSIVREGQGEPVSAFDGFLSASWERTATCGGGSPRFTLVFADGDYLVTDGAGSPGFSGCDLNDSFDTSTVDPSTTNIWRCHDNSAGAGTCTTGNTFMDWADVVANYGDLVVAESALVDDSFWRAPNQSESVYSNVVLGPPVPTKDDCKKGGWEELGFRNQGQCVSHFARS